MNLAALDLNLLVVLRALLMERSVTRAARRVGLTERASGHALAGQRHALGEHPLVGSGRLLVPTPRADALREPLEAALAGLERALEAPRPFDPGSSRRAFTIGASDYALFVLMPALLARLAQRAPGIDLRVRSDVAHPNANEWLASGEVDLAITVIGGTRGTGVHVEPLFSDEFACLVRRDHPRVKKRLTLETYAELPHAFVAPRGTPGGVVDDALRARGLQRRVALLLPNFLVAPHVVARSDLVVTLGARIARSFAEHLPLRVLTPPLPLPGFEMSLAWHARMDADAGHAWVREQIVRVSRELPSHRK